ncbi:MAG TPA: hypothetical protein VK821_20780 [Dehalococcoidia bacterium]|nr:hypothetical protein [Dehalococcoidia bacterium]
MDRRTHDYARILLALIRLLNGAAALLAPKLLARRLGIDPDVNPGALYVLRLFGIRTVLIGTDLLVQAGERRAESLRLGVLIHGSDTVAAALAAKSGRLPRGVGQMLVLISGLNTALAIYAGSRSADQRR